MKNKTDLLLIALRVSFWFNDRRKTKKKNCIICSKPVVLTLLCALNFPLHFPYFLYKIRSSTPVSICFCFLGPHSLSGSGWKNPTTILSVMQHIFAMLLIFFKHDHLHDRHLILVDDQILVYIILFSLLISSTASTLIASAIQLCRNEWWSEK
jgi:hypothetical protein